MDTDMATEAGKSQVKADNTDEFMGGAALSRQGMRGGKAAQADGVNRHALEESGVEGFSAVFANRGEDGHQQCRAFDTWQVDPAAARHAPVAQLVEHRLCNAEVAGSIPCPGHHTTHRRFGHTEE